MNQFKVGQKVRVVKYAEPFEADFANWHPFEKEYFPIGSIATITAIGRDGAINIADSEGNTAETLNPESFEPVEENMSQFKVGQRVRVVKHAAGIEPDFADWYQVEKRRFPIGSIATITEIDRDGAIYIINPEGVKANGLSPESFEPVEENMDFNAEEAIKQLQALGYTVTEPEFKLGQIWEIEYGYHYYLVCGAIGLPKFLLYNIRNGTVWSTTPALKPSEYEHWKFKLYANNLKEAIEKGLKF